jgi:hypothetical protein
MYEPTNRHRQIQGVCHRIRRFLSEVALGGVQESNVMSAEFLANLDIAKEDEPEADPDLRKLLTNWLDYQRRTFRRKLRNLDPEGIAEMSIPPVGLSILGLIRHMTQMEHVYLSWGLGGGDRVMVYGDDDFEGGSPDTLESDLALYLEEVEKADRAIASLPSLESVGLGHGRPLQAVLIKMVQEYAVHNGQAHMLRYAALGEVIR